MESSYIYSLSVEEILDKCFIKGKDKFIIDLNDRFVYAKVVQSKETYPDCAFFYQLKKTIEKVDSSIPFEQAVVYLDFGNIFTPISNKLKDKKTEIKKERQTKFLDYIKNKLFEAGTDDNRGLFIKFPGSDVAARFIPFDKSNSMARNCQMSFLRVDFKEEMNKCLMLDIEIKSAVLNKLYAYRGLYLTGGRRIEQEKGKFELNEKTVVVIKDDNSLLTVPKGTEILSAKKSEVQTSPDYTSWDICEKNDFDKVEKDEETGEEIRKITLNRFDGQGFISPEYAMYINDIMLNPVDNEGDKVSFCGLWERFFAFNNPERKTNNETVIRNVIADKYKDKMIYSMQIRLPFGKGVLHTVDFHTIINKKLEKNAYKKIQIKDAFGIIRDLSEAKIILTESMFKCKEWLEKYCEKINENDPMHYYFKHFKNNDHALYIANVDTNLPSGNLTSLNYQFLNPMALNNEQLNSLVDFHNEYVDRLEKNKLLQKKSLLDDLGNIDSEYADETILSSNQEPWAEVLRNTTKVIYDKKVAGMLNGMRESRIRDIIFGRFAVKGECRFLVRDLMAMVAHLVKKCQFDGHALSEEQKKIFTELELFGENFYLPDANIKLISGQEVVLLRNPHLSRNEEWICRYHPDDDRKKYLGHLKGIVEIGYNSMANMSLGGADFDGDIVKVVADSNVVKRVKDNCYADDDNCQRNIAVIEIPSGGKPTTDTIENDYTMQYDAIKNTFSSRIGQISNAAVQIGRWEYYPHYHEDDKERQNPIQIEKIENMCAEATILTGLEIDSCKNGEKPDISPVVSFKRNAVKSKTQTVVSENENDASKNKDEVIKEDGINYLKIKNKISDMLFYDKFGVKVDKLEDKNAGNSADDNTNNKSKTYHYTISSRMKTVTVPVDDADMPTLDKLPRIFAEKKYLDNQKAKKEKEARKAANEDKQPSSPKKELFAPLKFTDKAPKNKAVYFNVGKILETYNAVLKQASGDYKLEQALRNSNYIKKIDSILTLQYDDLSDKISDYFEFEPKGNEKTIETIRKEALKVLIELAQTIMTDNKANTPNECKAVLMEKMLGWIIEKKWQYLDEKSRKTALKDNMGIIDEALVAFFSNFSCGGYRLLYYYTKEVLGMFFMDTIVEEDDVKDIPEQATFVEEFEQEENEFLEFDTSSDNYLKAYLELYRKAKQEKKTKRNWLRELTETALKDIKKEIAANEKDICCIENWNKRAMQYVNALKSKDANRNFFWNAFSTQDILMYIEDKTTMEKEKTTMKKKREVK